MAALKGGDFDVYLEAANKMKDGLNIYAPPFINGLQYFYSPFFAWLLIPFRNHVFITEFVWLLLSYAMLYRTFRLVLKYFDTTLLPGKKLTAWIVLIFLFSVQFILYNVSMIQVTLFLFWAIFESLYQISHQKNTLGGIILGMAINIKIMPVLILPYLFYRGHFKALAAVVITLVALLIIPAIGFGIDYDMFLHVQWWKVINPENKEHLFETGIGTHSIVALLPVYLTGTIGEMPFKRNILNLDHQTVEMIINATRLFLLGLSIFYLKNTPFKKEENQLKSIWEISYFVLLIPLLMPHQQKYNFIMALPMISYLLYYFILTFRLSNNFRSKLAFYTLVVCLLLYSPLYGSDIIGKFLFLYTQHYRFLTFSTLLLIPVSLYCNPGRMNELIRRTTTGMPG